MKKIIAFLLTFMFVFSYIVPEGVVAKANVENIALNKLVSATSEWGGAFVKERINDGDLSSAWSSKGNEGYELNPKDDQGNEWIMIDLGALYDISSMIAYSRDNQSTSERKGWIYQIAKSSDFSDGVTIGTKAMPGVGGEGYEVALKKPITGRYVRVASPNYCVIAEVEVYGVLTPEKAEGTYADIEVEGDLYDASQLAYVLGFMDGISATEFGVEHIMTRADAAEIAARLQMSGELGYNETGYDDVPYEHEQSGYIAWCEQAGIVSAGKEFRPDDFITGTEFITMLLRLNGWDCLVKDGQYPANILAVANRIKLTKGVDINLNANLNKSRALLLIYKMLTTPMAVVSSVNKYGEEYAEGGTYLEEVFGLSLREGVVEAVKHTNLVEAVGTDSSIVKIDSLEYNDVSDIVSVYLGERVYFLSDQNDNISWMWRSSRLGKNVTVMCSDIIKSDSFSISYSLEDSKKNYRLSLESPIYFIKNGTASGDFRLNDLKRTNGKMVLIDNDKNGKIDVIKLYEPKVIVVDYIGVDDERLSIGAQNGDVLEVPSFEELIITRNGFPMSYTDVPSGSLIYAYVSDNKKHVELEVSLERITGKVEEISDSGITLDGIYYKFSDYYVENTSIMDDVKLGSEVSFLLDESGFIVWAINDAITSTGETLAVILGVYKWGFNRVEIMLYNENNEMLTLNCASKVKVDGKRMSISQLYALGQDYFKGKAVIYKLNSNGLVTYLNTENYNSSDEKPDVIVPQNKWNLPAGCERGAFGFFLDGSMVMPVYNNFPIFTIATDVDTGEIIIDESLANRFSYTDIDSLYPPTSSNNDTTGTFTFYGDGSEDSPAFSVRFLPVNTKNDVGTLSAYTSNNTLVLDRIRQCITPDYDYTFQLCGYDAATGTEVKLAVSPQLSNVVDSYKVYIEKQSGESPVGISFTGINYISTKDSTRINDYSSSIDSIKRGDVLRYEIEGGQITALERIYCVSDLISTGYIGNILATGDNYHRPYRAGYRAFSGNVLRVENNILEINVGATTEGFNYKSSNSSIKNVIVVEDGTIKSCEVSLLPMCMTIGNRVLVGTFLGKPSYLIVYK